MTGNERKNKNVYPGHPGISLAAARRQIDALKRKLDRILAAYRLKAAVSQIVRLWEIAVEKKKPVLDPIDCVHKVRKAGFRPESWNVLHGYIDHCQRFSLTPGFDEIIDKLSPPRKMVSLMAVLPSPAYDA